MLQYQDPWKDDKYGKLKGDKAEAFVRLTFEEAKVYKTDNAYIFAGMITSYKGVVRAYKPADPLNPGLCAVPVYGSEYEIRRKDDSGQYVSDKFQPTIFEKALYDLIKSNESIWMGDGINLAGQFSLAPNMMCEDLDSKALSDLVDSNIKLEGIDPTGTLPEYTPPKSYSNNKGGYKSYGMTPDQKLGWIKKQMLEDICDTGLTEGSSLIELVRLFTTEGKDEPKVIENYFKVLEACL